MFDEKGFGIMYDSIFHSKYKGKGGRGGVGLCRSHSSLDWSHGKAPYPLDIRPGEWVLKYLLHRLATSKLKIVLVAYFVKISTVPNMTKTTTFIKSNGYYGATRPGNYITVFMVMEVQPVIRGSLLPLMDGNSPFCCVIHLIEWKLTGFAKHP